MRREKRTYDARTLVFLAVAVLLVVVLDYLIDPIKPPTPVSPQEEEVQLQTLPTFAPPYDLSTEMIDAAEDGAVGEDEAADTSLPPVMLPLPPWRAYAVPTGIAPDDPRPRVVIIIDDMGLDRRNSRAVMDLPGPLTLAFLPYADDLPAQTAQAREQGHELMVHVPMEPLNGTIDSGPNTLRSEMTEDEFYKSLSANLFAFDSYVGINNHMGSRLTQDRDAMRRVMAQLHGRGLLFVDSKTINSSIAADEAAAALVPHAVRDVFLDHEVTYEFAADALDKLERIARRNGRAIAIGHPKPQTIEALRAWLPTLEEKGFVLVPVSAVVSVPPVDSGGPE